MPSRHARFLLLILAAVAFPAAMAPHPATAAPQPSMTASTKPLPRIIFVAPKGVSILLHGTYPKVPSPCRQPVQPLLHARYAGVIEVGKDTDGSLFVVGELPIEEYLQGLGEMPLTWPLEALKAQAVAARTYALAHLDQPDETGARLGYQLCATDACQVYRGLGVSAAPYGDRWRKAVRATAGQVLLYGGRPAEAFYFSTSNGQTYGNDQVFGGAPLPYLRSVKENDDGASSLSHWTASLSFADIGRYLSAAGGWPSGTSISTVTQSGSNIVVSGHGTSRTLEVSTFRSDLNSWAHCLDPSKYPTTDGGSRLPQTVPSTWFSVTSSHEVATLVGRGWGHGVGMVQWGAYGKAKRGLSYSDILAAYYGGLRPASSHEPSTIRVGIATGLTSLTVEPSGDVTVEGRQLATGAPWKLTGGTRLRVRHARPLVAGVDPGSISGPGHGASGHTRRATVSVPETSVVQLVLVGNEVEVPVTKAATFTTGTRKVRWTVPAVPSGSYVLQSVVTTNGVDMARTAGVPMDVVGVAATSTPTPTPASPSTTPTAVAASPGGGTSRHDNALIWLILSGVAAVGILVGSALYLRHRSERMGSNWDPGSPPPPGSL